MYAFVLRAHQKIDKVAYRQLKQVLGANPPITIKDILYFEGKRGPDSARLKRGDNPPPWHFYQPQGDNQEFLQLLIDHHDQMAKELSRGNLPRAAFEAAWLAHAIVDGLTPAHHYPYEEELEKIRNEEKHTRQSVRSHLIVKGVSSTETVMRSLKLIGPKGLLTTHTTFEAGAAMIILPLTLKRAKPSQEDIALLEKTSFIDIFEAYVHKIEDLKIYLRFYKRGWTESLARDVRQQLAPLMVRAVTIAWLSAIKKSGK